MQAKNWNLTFEAEVGTRFHRYFRDITTFGENSWYSTDQRKWLPVLDGGACSTHHACRTLKSFLSHLNDHPELRGQEVILVNRYEGFDVTANYLL